MIFQTSAPLAIRRSILPSIWDFLALLLVIGMIGLVVYGADVTTAPLSTLSETPLSLDPSGLPLYALRTMLRMLLAIIFALVFTFIYLL